VSFVTPDDDFSCQVYPSSKGRGSKTTLISYLDGARFDRLSSLSLLHPQTASGKLVSSSDSSLFNADEASGCLSYLRD